MRIGSILEPMATDCVIARVKMFRSGFLQIVCGCLIGVGFPLVPTAEAQRHQVNSSSPPAGTLCEQGAPGEQLELIRSLAFSRVGRTSQVTFQAIPQARVFNSLGIIFNPISNNSGADPITQLKIRLDMPTMGHGSRPPRVQTLTDYKLDPLSETFQATQFFLPMGGCWVVQVEVTTRAGVSDAARFEVRLPHSHGSH